MINIHNFLEEFHWDRAVVFISLISWSVISITSMRFCYYIWSLICKWLSVFLISWDLTMCRKYFLDDDPCWWPNAKKCHSIHYAIIGPLIVQSILPPSTHQPPPHPSIHHSPVHPSIHPSIHPSFVRRSIGFEIFSTCCEQFFRTSYFSYWHDIKTIFSDFSREKCGIHSEKRFSFAHLHMETSRKR